MCLTLISAGKCYLIYLSTTLVKCSISQLTRFYLTHETMQFSNAFHNCNGEKLNLYYLLKWELQYEISFQFRPLWLELTQATFTILHDSG